MAAPLAAYKAICVDALDPVAVGTFWAGALGLQLHRRVDGLVYLTGDAPTDIVWVNPVPEAKTAKHRMHVDVATGSLDELVALGATVVDDQSFHWTAMLDPEGGEFCAFVRDAVSRRFVEVILDCAEGDGTGQVSHDVATWWAMVFGASVVDDPQGYSWVEGIPGTPFETLDAIPVPEPKVGKNRLHLDVTCAAVEPLLDAGATLLRAPDDEIAWHVLADPWGNELCAFVD